ncbi:DUF3189 family protein [Moorellaceae bacterium AZ2]
MIFIYTCFSGTVAALAAALHLGQLPPDKCPPWEELLTLPYFNRKIKRGKLFLRGQDPWGRRVYIAAVGPYGRLARQIITSFLPMWGLPGEAVVVVDAGEKVSSLVLLGCWLKAPKLIYWGLRKSYRQLSQRVRQVRDDR